MSQLWDIKIRKLLTPRKMHILRYLGSEFCEMSKGTFAISHKISNLYTEKCALTDFYVCIWFTKSLNYDVISLSETVPWSGWHHALHTPSAFVAFVRGIHDDVIRWKYFRVTGLCEGNPPVTSGFPSQRSMTRSFDVFFLSAPEQTAEQTIEAQVISHAVAFIMMSLWWHRLSEKCKHT